MPSFAEFQDRFRRASLRELITLAGGGVDGLSFGAIAALGERFLDIAFQDEATEPNDRILSAAWAAAIHSLLLLMLEKQPETLAGYLRARESSQDERTRFGYGSAGHLAGSAAVDAPLEVMRQRHALLLAVAFGGHSSAAVAGAA
jgi:hypothetical protein